MGNLHFFTTLFKNEWKEQLLVIKRSTRVIFIRNEKIFNIDEIGVDKILVSKRESYGKKGSLKYFIGYNDNDVIRL